MIEAHIVRLLAIDRSQTATDSASEEIDGAARALTVTFVVALGFQEFHRARLSTHKSFLCATGTEASRPREKSARALRAALV